MASFSSALLADLAMLTEWRRTRRESALARVAAEKATLDAQVAALETGLRRQVAGLDSLRRGGGSGGGLDARFFAGLDMAQARIEQVREQIGACQARLASLREEAGKLAREIEARRERAECYRRLLRKEAQRREEMAESEEPHLAR